jgi:hypothetical protein
MRRALLLLAVPALAFAPAPFPKADRRPGCADLKAMQGGWVLVRETYANGPPRPKRHLRASVAGRHVTFSPEGDALAGPWALALAPGEEPKAMDLTLAGGRRMIHPTRRGPRGERAGPAPPYCRALYAILAASTFWRADGSAGLGR